MATLTIADLDNGKRDLQTVDAVANNPEDFTQTRYGDSVLTLAGALRRLGYEPPVPYASGLVVSSGVFTVERSGIVYAPVPSLVPFTAGAWDPAQWLVVQVDPNLRADLAASGGAALVGFGSRTAQGKLRDIVNAKDFVGFDATGSTSSVAAITAAFTLLGAAGGLVFIPNEAKARISNTISIPANCALVGPHENVGSPGDNTSAPYGDMGGALIIDSAATITVDSNAALKGCLIYRSGMTFPTVDASAFAGTAVTINGDDATVSNNLIMGFNKAIYSTGNQRQRIENVWFDCVNGIEITNCLDIPYVNKCHGWPFATINASAAGTPGASIIRTGIAYYLHDTVDWAKLTDCFSYGYFRGFQLTGVNSCTLLSCSADNTSLAGVPTHPGSIGFSIGGQENRLIGCQAAAQDSAAVSVASNVGTHTTIVGLNAWACGTHGVLLTQGDLTLVSSNFRSMSNGVSFASASSKFLGGNNRFQSVSSPWTFAVACDTNNIRLGEFVTDQAAGTTPVGGVGSFVAPSVASANPLSIPISANEVNVTGTTNFGTLQRGWAGRPPVTLIFDGALQVFSSTGVATAIRLSGGATFNTTTGSTLTLKHDGTQWYEIGRSA